MKKVLVSIIILIFCLSCKEGERSMEVNEMPTANTESFDWLLGEWKRTNEQEGKETFETWEKAGHKEYQGFGFTMVNEDTIWQESIKLIKRDNSWNFEVTGQGEIQPTIFRITNIDTGKFHSENQENAFPKVISYFRKGDNLQAIISGGGTEIPFEFEPVY